ncbi:HAD-IA family hydrolase [Piscinibacterium candidicorallinum]|uniref:HAD-IA family hydrolase n=1 Tax=Piscinibacterium candidicorallinum TaxID=1793872 RepID=A0ABV7H398_9BURK
MSRTLYDAVVFDWDGTLIDSTATIAKCIQAACADADVPIPDWNTALSVIGLALTPALARCAPTATPAQLQTIINRYRYHYLLGDDQLALFEGAQELLSDLRAASFRLAVATGKNRRGLDRALELTGLGEVFHTTRCADETAGKPDPLMLHEIMDELDLSAVRTLMVGDTTHDLQMALRASCPAAAVTQGAHPEDELLRFAPVVCVPTVAHLREHLALLAPSR